MMSSPTYAGIGSRHTPVHVLEAMTTIASELGAAGWRLRTGGAEGADSAFAAGAPDGTTELWLPWRGYNGLHGRHCHVLDRTAAARAESIVSKVHRGWHRLSQGSRKLHARNAAIIHGGSLADPVDAVVCWTPNGVPVGGTATGIHMAERARIPVLNLARLSGEGALARMRALHE